LCTALDRLQALRDDLAKPFNVCSVYRSPEHNRAVRGAKRSKHMEGIASDIVMSNHDPVVVPRKQLRYEALWISRPRFT
jgi:uncharacterized protein YcbK (DUF882 family)